MSRDPSTDPTPLDRASFFAHAARLAEIVRQHARKLPTLSEREAVARLRPHGQGVKSAPALAPISRPLTTHAPSAQNQNGARVQQPLSDAESTG